MRFKLLRDDAKMPERAYEGDAGFDIYLPEDLTLRARETKKIDLGVSVEFPGEFFGLICPRSSISAKGILVHLGVVDSGYRGELKCVVTNLNFSEVSFGKHTRVVQLVSLRSLPEMLARSAKVVEDLSDTERGEKGYGSSGA